MAEAQTGPQEAFAVYSAAAAYRDSADLIANDALYYLCMHVVHGTLSVRAVARGTGLSKSHVARLVESVRNGAGLASLTPRLLPDVHEHLYERITGVAAPAPFVLSEEDASVRWREV